MFKNYGSYNCKTWKQKTAITNISDITHSTPMVYSTLRPTHFFYLISYRKRVSAIHNVLSNSGQIKKNSIFYDRHNDVVFYETLKNINHRCDMAKKKEKRKKVKIMHYNFNLKWTSLYFYLGHQLMPLKWAYSRAPNDCKTQKSKHSPSPPSFHAA